MMTKKRFFMALTAAIVLSIASFSSAAAEKTYLIPEFALWYHYDYEATPVKKGMEPVPNLQFKDNVFKYNVTIPYETDSLVLKLGWMEVNITTGNLTHANALSDSVVPAIKVVDDVTGHTYGDKDFKSGSDNSYFHREYWVPYPKDVTAFKGHVEVSFPVGFPVPGYSGTTLRYDVTIKRDDINNVTTLKYLEVARFGNNKDTTYTRFELTGNDFPQLSSSDGPFTVAAKTETDSFQVRLVTSSALVDSVWYRAASVNGGGDTATVAGPGGTRVTVDSLRIGDEVYITVLAENKVNSETYRVILNAAPGESAPDGKPLQKKGYVSAVWLEDKVDGRDTVFALSPNFIGLIKNPSANNPYTAAVPDPSSPYLKVKVEYNKAMDMIRSDSILKAYKVVDQNDDSKFSFEVKLTDKDGKNPNPDSTFTINLKSSENRLADLVLRADSASGAPLVLKPAFHPNITSYEVTTLLPHDAAVLHLFAAAKSTSVDSIVYITDTKRMMPNDTVNNLVSAVKAEAGRSSEWQVKVYAASGDLETYKVKFRKAFNLNVKEITVTYDSKPLEIAGKPGEADFMKKFEYDVLVDTSIPLSKYEEIKVDFALASDESVGKGLVKTEFLEKETGKWTQVLRLTPDVGDGREYRVNLLTPSADADLKYFYVEPGFSHLLEPAFSPSVTEYELRLPAGTTDLSFVAVAQSCSEEKKEFNCSALDF
jgi:hypothetical protein